MEKKKDSSLLGRAQNTVGEEILTRVLLFRTTYLLCHFTKWQND